MTPKGSSGTLMPWVLASLAFHAVLLMTLPARAEAPKAAIASKARSVRLVLPPKAEVELPSLHEPEPEPLPEPEPEPEPLPEPEEAPITEVEPEPVVPEPEPVLEEVLPELPTPEATPVPPAPEATSRTLPPIQSIDMSSIDARPTESPRPVTSRRVAPLQKDLRPVPVEHAPPVPVEKVAPTPPEEVPPQEGDANEDEAAVEVEAVPDPARAPRPKYPRKARVRGWQGTVMLEVDVSEDGRPLSVVLYKSSGHAILDKAAIETVRTWTFVPGKNQGRAIRSKVRVPVRFRLVDR